MINKIQKESENFYYKELFYESARVAMYDLVNILYKHKYHKIFIPSYVGWSPKEGSGIFDPLNKISLLEKRYYPLNKDLDIKYEFLVNKLEENSILLMVNYFGFRDSRMDHIIELAHKRHCVVIEDNAHGFFTFHLNKKKLSDFSFFSLHKMFTFPNGGSLIINNKKYNDLPFEGTKSYHNNPYNYDIYSISEKRLYNFKKLYLYSLQYSDYFYPLKSLSDIIYNVPQTFPIVILKGNRDKIYDMMNEKGYGVVSLYHTLIDELQSEVYKDTLWLSQNILNLPLHQDVDDNFYKAMMDQLINCMKELEQYDKNF